MCRLQWHDVQLLNVSLYNISMPHKIGIWVITTLKTSTWDLCVFFRIEQLSATVPHIPGELDTSPMSPFMHNENICLFDLLMRDQSPVLRKISNLGRVKLGTSGKEILAVEEVENGLTHQLTGGYLMCFGTSVCREEACGTLTSWKEHLLKDFNLCQPQVYLKTSRGVYVYDSRDTSPKKARLDSLTIEEIFSPVDTILHVAGSPITVRTFKTPFHILWVDNDSVWNGYLSEFFRALYVKLYGNFFGLKPILAYVFPAAVESPTFFTTIFTSFPFLCLRFGKPVKTSCVHLQRDCLKILAKLPNVIRSPLADKVLDIKVLKKPITNMWPLLTRELNGSLAGDNKVIIIKECNVVEIDFTKAFLISCNMPYAVYWHEQMLEIVNVITDEMKDSLVSKYNEFLYAIISSGNRHSFTWASISKCIVHMVGPELVNNTQFLEEILHRLSAVYSGNQRDITVSTQNLKVGMFTDILEEIKLIKPLCLEENRQPVTFQGVCEDLLSYSLCLCGHSKNDILWKILLAMWQQRRNTSFWLKETMNIEYPTIRPKGLFFTIAPAFYLHTKHGMSFWLQDKPLPSCFDYTPYIMELCDLLQMNDEERDLVLSQYETLLNLS
ncbi:helicase-primase subunit [Wood mouse herpesvirus]|uniref:Helicase-primase subunit n=1 Tax=Wood mouse herpesvirus TaxID=432370 RepID=D0U1N0_9GAMA|nr:helicase-primase subunit [Wood mouse herpesvirus]ACY41112.1 helicase-primase subunit [Wood mouse herpesvirus]